MSIGYLFGGSTGETQESLAKKRAIAEAMMERSTSRVPQNVGEGLASIGQALAGRFAMSRLAKQEGALNDYNAGVRSRIGAALFGGAPGAAPTPGQATVADALTGGAAKADNPNLPSRFDFARAEAPFTTGAAGAGQTTGGSTSADLSGNQIYNQFMGTVGGAIKNPNALAAIAATGKAESAFHRRTSFANGPIRVKAARPATQAGSCHGVPIG